jgi:hypothetical protein
MLNTTFKTGNSFENTKKSFVTTSAFEIEAVSHSITSSEDGRSFCKKLKQEYDTIDQEDELKKLDEQFNKFKGRVKLVKTKVDPKTGKKIRIVKIARPNKKNKQIRNE